MENANKGLPKVVAKVNAEQEEMLSKLPSLSAKIRYLQSEGFSTPENKYSGIANYLNIRTQHVRNVLNQELKKK